MKIEERIANLETLVTSLNAELTVLKEELDKKEARILELEAEVSKATVNEMGNIQADSIETVVGNTKIVQAKDAIILQAGQGIVSVAHDEIKSKI